MAIIRRTGGVKDRLIVECGRGKTATIDVVHTAKKTLFYLNDSARLVRHENIKRLHSKAKTA